MIIGSFQDVFLFEGTLKDNLSYGCANVSENTIWNALEHCQAKELVKMRGGLFAKVKSGGANFSLGERQLFALTRAFISSCDILILDEATASVDVATEKRLQTATKELLFSRTSIVIAHRLSTIYDCDKIFVFHRGSLVEEGSHVQLLSWEGTYAKWVALQEKEADLLVLENEPANAATFAT